MNEDRKVELVQAFLWTCDECGRDQFERAINIDSEAMEGSEAAELVDAAVSELRNVSVDLGIHVGGNWFIAPDHVKCNHCGSEFEVV